jgi:hypothetical protein
MASITGGGLEVMLVKHPISDKVRVYYETLTGTGFPLTFSGLHNTSISTHVYIIDYFFLSLL